MAEYIRCELGYWTDPRTLRLKRMLGPLGGEYFLRLQAFAFRMAPSTGDLAGFTPAEIAKACGYPDKHPPEKLLGAFVEATWCDWSTDGEGTQSVRIRSWEVLQPFAVNSEKRSEKARKAANAAWAKRAELLAAAGGASDLGSSGSSKRKDGNGAGRRGAAAPSSAEEFAEEAV